MFPGPTFDAAGCGGGGGGGWDVFALLPTRPPLGYGGGGTDDVCGEDGTN